jgi:hypothetical protein
MQWIRKLRFRVLVLGFSLVALPVAFGLYAGSRQVHEVKPVTLPVVGPDWTASLELPPAVKAANLYSADVQLAAASGNGCHGREAAGVLYDGYVVTQAAGLPADGTVSLLVDGVNEVLNGVVVRITASLAVIQVDFAFAWPGTFPGGAAQLVGGVQLSAVTSGPGFWLDAVEFASAQVRVQNGALAGSLPTQLTGDDFPTSITGDWRGLVFDRTGRLIGIQVQGTPVLVSSIAIEAAVAGDPNTPVKVPARLACQNLG